MDPEPVTRPVRALLREVPTNTWQSAGPGANAPVAPIKTPLGSRKRKAVRLATPNSERKRKCVRPFISPKSPSLLRSPFAVKNISGVVFRVPRLKRRTLALLPEVLGGARASDPTRSSVVGAAPSGKTMACVVEKQDRNSLAADLGTNASERSPVSRKTDSETVTSKEAVGSTEMVGATLMKQNAVLAPVDTVPAPAPTPACMEVSVPADFPSASPDEEDPDMAKKVEINKSATKATPTKTDSADAASLPAGASKMRCELSESAAKCVQGQWYSTLGRFQTNPLVTGCVVSWAVAGWPDSRIRVEATTGRLLLDGWVLDPATSDETTKTWRSNTAGDGHKPKASIVWRRRRASSRRPRKKPSLLPTTNMTTRGTVRTRNDASYARIGDRVREIKSSDGSDSQPRVGTVVWVFDGDFPPTYAVQWGDKTEATATDHRPSSAPHVNAYRHSSWMYPEDGLGDAVLARAHEVERMPPPKQDESELAGKRKASKLHCAKRSAREPKKRRVRFSKKCLVRIYNTKQPPTAWFAGAPPPLFDSDGAIYKLTNVQIMYQLRARGVKVTNTASNPERALGPSRYIKWRSKLHDYIRREIRSHVESLGLGWVFEKQVDAPTLAQDRARARLARALSLCMHGRLAAPGPGNDANGVISVFRQHSAVERTRGKETKRLDDPDYVQGKACFSEVDIEERDVDELLDLADHLGLQRHIGPRDEIAMLLEAWDDGNPSTEGLAHASKMIKRMTLPELKTECDEREIDYEHLSPRLLRRRAAYTELLHTPLALEFDQEKHENSVTSDLRVKMKHAAQECAEERTIHVMRRVARLFGLSTKGCDKHELFDLAQLSNE